jgi:hypothetical protein
MIVGEPPGFTSAMLFPATSVVTLSAKVPASVRQTRAATVSNPEGESYPGLQREGRPRAVPAHQHVHAPRARRDITPLRPGAPCVTMHG